MVSHRRIEPSPPQLSKDRPSLFHSTSKTGQPFRCPSRMLQGSLPMFSKEWMRIDESSQPTAIRRPRWQVFAQQTSIPESSQVAAIEDTELLLA
mmetsp:Transcript_13680/g.37815  ORF Transcript_13680/g.37815 Transcript_13680/m.37815 type:complete len:94 (+) Transcript_13680:982-1263(+)